MSDPTLAELAARVTAIETKLGMGPVVPPPTPRQKPAAPTGLRATTLPDKRIQLDCDPATDADSWDVLDLANLDAMLKETVTVPRSIRSPLKPGDKRAYAFQARNAAGLSPMSNVVYLPPPATPTPVPGPVPTAFPADIVGKNWYLTLPVPRADGLATEIHQPALATYTSKYFELTPARDAIVFRCWHGGATTSGSKNPRSELREEINDGAAHAWWPMKSGRHTMEVVGQVNRLTKVKPQVVLHQIHGRADDTTVWRLEGSSLWITNGDNAHGYLVTDKFQLGQRYSLATDVDGGTIRYFYNGTKVPFELPAPADDGYFKVGCYLQSNPTSAPSESTSEYAEVVVFSAVVTHT